MRGPSPMADAPEEVPAYLRWEAIMAALEAERPNAYLTSEPWRAELIALAESTEDALGQVMLGALDDAEALIAGVPKDREAAANTLASKELLAAAFILAGTSAELRGRPLSAARFALQAYEIAATLNAMQAGDLSDTEVAGHG